MKHSVIRAANQQDAYAIAHVHVASWQTTYAGIVPQDYLKTLDPVERKAMWQGLLMGDHEIFVAELDCEIVGFASGGPIREPIADCDAELYAIYLLAHAQGSGLGSAMLQQLAAALYAKGYKSMMVWVLEQNPAKLFYQTWGAVPVTTGKIEIGGVSLNEIALAWPNLARLLQRFTPV